MATRTPRTGGRSDACHTAVRGAPGRPPPEIQAFVNDTLKPLLKEGEKKQLNNAEGHWPLFVRTLAELTEKHRAALPGMASPDFWNAMRTALPDLPRRTLEEFALKELDPQTISELRQKPLDPAKREELTKKYYDLHPDALQRQLQPSDHPKPPWRPHKGRDRPPD